MKVAFCFMASFAFTLSVFADQNNADKRLVEISYSFQRSTSISLQPISMTFWISEDRRGIISDDPNWSRKSWSVSSEGNDGRAKRCMDLLKALTEPGDISGDPTRVLTVRCIDGYTSLEKRFAADRLPREIRKILLLMGFSEEQTKSLEKFTDNA